MTSVINVEVCDIPVDLLVHWDGIITVAEESLPKVSEIFGERVVRAFGDVCLEDWFAVIPASAMVGKPPYRAVEIPFSFIEKRVALRIRVYDQECIVTAKIDPSGFHLIDKECFGELRKILPVFYPVTEVSVFWDTLIVFQDSDDFFVDDCVHFPVEILERWDCA